MTVSDYKMNSEPIQKAAQKMWLSESMLLDEILPFQKWKLQRRLDELKHSMLNFLIQSGQVPLGPAEVSLELRIDQKTISDRVLELTQGKRIEVQPNQPYVMWRTSTPIKIDIPLTDAERGWRENGYQKATMGSAGSRISI